MARRAASGYVASKMGCANGRGPEFHLHDPSMKLGLVRVRETKEVVVPPEKPVCMYCGLDRTAAARSALRESKEPTDAG